MCFRESVLMTENRSPTCISVSKLDLEVTLTWYFMFSIYFSLTLLLPDATEILIPPIVQTQSNHAGSYFRQSRYIDLFHLLDISDALGAEWVKYIAAMLMHWNVIVLIFSSISVFIKFLVSLQGCNLMALKCPINVHL